MEAASRAVIPTADDELIGVRMRRGEHRRVQAIAAREQRKMQTIMDRAVKIGLDFIERHPSPIAEPSWEEEPIEARA